MIFLSSIIIILNYLEFRWIILQCCNFNDFYLFTCFPINAIMLQFFNFWLNWFIALILFPPFFYYSQLFIPINPHQPPFTAFSVFTIFTFSLFFLSNNAWDCRLVWFKFYRNEKLRTIKKIRKKEENRISAINQLNKKTDKWKYYRI